MIPDGWNTRIGHPVEEVAPRCESAFAAGEE